MEVTIQEKLRRIAEACTKVLLAHKERVPEHGKFFSLSVSLTYPEDEHISGLISIDYSAENPRLRIVQAGIGFMDGYYTSHILFTGTRQEVLDWLAEKDNYIVIADHLFELKEKFTECADNLP